MFTFFQTQPAIIQDRESEQINRDSEMGQYGTTIGEANSSIQASRSYRLSDLICISCSLIIFLGIIASLLYLTTSQEPNSDKNKNAILQGI